MLLDTYSVKAHFFHKKNLVTIYAAGQQEQRTLGLRSPNISYSSQESLLLLIFFNPWSSNTPENQPGGNGLQKRNGFSLWEENRLLQMFKSNRDIEERSSHYGISDTDSLVKVSELPSLFRLLNNL
jgi:hypothetical protein